MHTTSWWQKAINQLPKSKTPLAGADGFVEIQLRTWKQFKSSLFETIKKEQAKYGYGAAERKPNFLFRGQSCSNWHLLSNFDRIIIDREKVPAEVTALYDDMLRAFFDNGHELDAFGPELSFFDVSSFELIANKDNLHSDLEAYAQHHGLPTRLLDWSESPYVAAFFAAAEPDKCRSRHIAIWCLDTNGAAELLSDHDLFIQSRNLHAGQRQVWQRAAFTINRTNMLETDKVFLSSSGRLRITPKFPVLFKFTIPVSQTAEILRDLEFMRITYLSIYPDTEGVVKYTKFKLAEKLAKL